MSYEDYLRGARDGFNVGLGVGFIAGAKKGLKVGYQAGLEDGYGSGYVDGKLKLPYDPPAVSIQPVYIPPPVPKPEPIDYSKWLLPKPEPEVKPLYCEPTKRHEFEPLPIFEKKSLFDDIPKYEPPEPDYSWIKKLQEQ